MVILAFTGAELAGGQILPPPALPGSVILNPIPGRGLTPCRQRSPARGNDENRERRDTETETGGRRPRERDGGETETAETVRQGGRQGDGKRARERGCMRVLSCACACVRVVYVDVSQGKGDVDSQ